MVPATARCAIVAKGTGRRLRQRSAPTRGPARLRRTTPDADRALRSRRARAARTPQTRLPYNRPQTSANRCAAAPASRAAPPEDRTPFGAAPDPRRPRPPDAHATDAVSAATPELPDLGPRRGLLPVRLLPARHAGLAGAGDLMRDFGLTAAGLGNLAGLLLLRLRGDADSDRRDGRPPAGRAGCSSAGSVLAGAGSAAVRAGADRCWWPDSGRALIGAAHGVAWVSMLKLVGALVSRRRASRRISGLSLAVGTLGAVLAGPPLRWLADAFGWRSVIAASGTLALAAGGGDLAARCATTRSIAAS
ncbi:MAG: hypothetical protein MZW92_12805 [Comamonadaceae bacterium]|nr:hypothetical protein [Comamonadaceae bacterium]